MTGIWDELDVELLSNDLKEVKNNNLTRRGVITNTFDEFPINPDKPDFILLPTDHNLSEFHTYRMDWHPDRVDWYIEDDNGTPVLLRTETQVVPDDPMRLHLNIHVPGPGFIEAHDSDLAPAATPALNKTYYLEIDYVTVTPEPTTALILSCLGITLLRRPRTGRPFLTVLRKVPKRAAMSFQVRRGTSM